jgi:nucleoside-diphosphate-sugar epimerase
MTILVTGSTGLIGTHLVWALKGKSSVVSLVHEEPRGLFQLESIDGTIQAKADVRDFKTLRGIMARYYVDQVYHLAALAEVKSAYKDPLNVYDVNVMGCVSVLEAARQLDIPKLSILITDKVYGEQWEADEDSMLYPSEPYATSKVAQQYIAESYAQTYGMGISIPHSPNVFGYDPYSNRIFPNTIRKCLLGQFPLIYTNDRSIREYIYVKDLVRMLQHLLDHEIYGPVNISTGWVRNQEEVVRTILKRFPNLQAVTREGDLPKQIQRQTMKSKRLDWRPSYTFEEALDETIELFKYYMEDWAVGVPQENRAVEVPQVPKEA